MAGVPSRKDRVYDFKALIETYVVARSLERRTHLGGFEKDCRTYYLTLLARLEELFDIRLSESVTPSPEMSRRNSIHPFFNTTIDSLQAIRTPLTGWDEAGFLTDIQECGEVGQEVRRTLRRIEDLCHASHNAHHQMLHALFECMYGKVETVVSSEQLRQAGFDDSKYPDYRDYDEYHYGM